MQGNDYIENNCLLTEVSKWLCNTAFVILNYILLLLTISLISFLNSRKCGCNFHRRFCPYQIPVFVSNIIFAYHLQMVIILGVSKWINYDLNIKIPYFHHLLLQLEFNMEEKFVILGKCLRMRKGKSSLNILFLHNILLNI